MKQIEVTILGQSYVLGCPDGGEALLNAAVHTVDREMSAIRDAGKVKARERIAVLAALNLAYQLADDGKAIEVRVFVHAPYDQYVNAGTRFWNASGIDVSIGANGVDIRTQSLVALIMFEMLKFTYPDYFNDKV